MQFSELESDALCLCSVQFSELESDALCAVHAYMYLLFFMKGTCQFMPCGRQIGYTHPREKGGRNNLLSGLSYCTICMLLVSDKPGSWATTSCLMWVCFML